MPRLTLPLLPGGVLLDVGVGASRSVTGPANRPITKRALLDTGADMTVVSPATIAAIRPQKIGTIPLGRVGGGGMSCDTYDIRLRFGGHGEVGRCYGLEVVEVHPATPGVDVLIGMDLLIRINMFWSGSNRQVILDH